jgi:hypothetical protein
MKLFVRYAKISFATYEGSKAPRKLTLPYAFPTVASDGYACAARWTEPEASGSLSKRDTERETPRTRSGINALR